MQTTILIDSRLIEEPTRKELMQKLNRLLNTKFNWSRLNRLDLERLVLAVQKLTARLYVEKSKARRIK